MKERGKTTTKRRIALASLLVVIIAGGLSSVIVPLLTAGMSRSVYSEMVATVGTINTLCRIYQQKHSKPPPNLTSIISSEHYDETDLDGIYFQHKDYVFNSFGDMGNERFGILNATAINPKNDLFCELIWNPETREYKISVRGDPRDRKVLRKQIVLILFITATVSAIIFPIYLKKSKKMD